MFKTIAEKVTVADLSAVLLAAVWALWGAIKELRFGIPIPSGAVVAFDIETGCPSGWREYENARGRAIIGANQNGTHGYQSRPFGVTGGAESHALTEPEMPPHTHNPPAGYSVWLYKSGGGADHRLTDFFTPGGRPDGFGSPGQLQAAGQGVPHNNMQPYLALYFCKKD